MPFTDYAIVTGEAASKFTPVEALGPFRGWKRFGGQYFTSEAGGLNLATGEFLEATRSERFWIQFDRAASYGADAAIFSASHEGENLWDSVHH